MCKGLMIYGCDDKPSVPLVGPWGMLSYAPAMVGRQFGLMQFVPITKGLHDFDLDFGDNDTRPKNDVVINLWRQVKQMKCVEHSIATTLDTLIGTKIMEMVLLPLKLFYHSRLPRRLG